jgi:hypothetical protein
LAGEPLQVFKGTPVLKQKRTAEIPEIFSVQETFFGVCEQRRQHGRHRARHRNPFIGSPPFIDSHTDQKNNKGFIGLCCVSSVENASHFLFSYFK